MPRLRRGGLAGERVVVGGALRSLRPLRFCWQVGPGPGPPAGALAGRQQQQQPRESEGGARVRGGSVWPLCAAGGSLGRQQAMPLRPFAAAHRGPLPLPPAPGPERYDSNGMWKAGWPMRRIADSELPSLQGSRLVGGNYTLYCAPGFEARGDNWGSFWAGAATAAALTRSRGPTEARDPRQATVLGSSGKF